MLSTIGQPARPGGLRLFCVALAIAAFVITGSAALSADVTTWHNDTAHTGQNLAETILKPANVNNRFFGKLYAFPIDGYAYAQPLYLSQLDIPGKGKHNVIFAATEHDSVYAFDADGNNGPNSSPQSILWQVSFIDPANGIAPLPSADVRTQDLIPEIGITGTPVIDRASGTMYLVERTKEIRKVADKFSATSQPAMPRVHDEIHWVQHLHALDITSGAEKFGGPYLLGDTSQNAHGDAINNKTEIRVKGKGEGTADGMVSFNALTQHQRPALALDRGSLYLAYASHGDNQPVHGWLLAFDASTLKLKSALCTSPDGSIATSWMAGASPAIDVDGNVYLATGNGDSDAQNGGRDYGECLMRVSNTPDGLHVSDFFLPANFAALNANDLDLGSGGPLLLPDQPGAHPHILVVAGKEGIVYVLDRDRLGKLSYNNTAALQSLHGLNYLKVLDHHEINVINTPAYYNGWLYYTSRSDPVSQFKVESGKITDTPIHQARLQFNFPPPTPSISANGNSDGIVWVLNNGSPAQLLAYDATDVSKLLFDSNSLGSRDQLGGGVKFCLPTIADGKVFVGSQESITVYGLLPPAKVRPADPTGLAASTIGANEIDLTWADNAGNESGYKIERATSDGEFSQINTTGRNTTSYADKNAGLEPETVYRYRIRATNAAGDSGFSSIVSATTAAAVADAGLVSHWTFDEGTGPTAGDTSPNNFNGEIHGEVVWARGHVGSAALGFHGAGVAPGYVSIADQPQLRFTAAQSFTVSAWIDPAAPPDKWAGFVVKSNDAAPGYGLWGDPENHWAFGMPHDSTLIIGGEITLGWHHVAAVQDGPAHTRRLFVDGIKVAEGAAADANGNGEMWIGGGKGDDRDYVDARIDDVRVYARPLDADEVATLAGRHNPAAVVDLDADAVDVTKIRLRWARDGSEKHGSELGFRIERAIDGANFSQIARAPAGSSSYTDITNLVVDTTYSYRIRATNSAGDAPDSNVAVTRLTRAPIAHAATSAPTTRPILFASVKEQDSAAPALVKANLQIGDPLFVDRGYTLDAVADNGINLAGAEHIVTANANKSHGKYSITYKLTQKCDVYLIVSTRTLRSPALPGGASAFANTNATLTAGAAGSFRIFKTTQDAGTYTLGSQFSSASFFSIAAKPAK